MFCKNAIFVRHFSDFCFRLDENLMEFSLGKAEDPPGRNAIYGEKFGKTKM